MPLKAEFLEKIRICKQYDRRLGELNEKIKRKAHVKQSFSLDFLERGTFTEYPYIVTLSGTHTVTI